MQHIILISLNSTQCQIPPYGYGFKEEFPLATTIASELPLS